MKVNREGFGVIGWTFAGFAVVVLVVWLLLPVLFFVSVLVAVALLFCGVVAFFREPRRAFRQEEGAVFSPCDGRICIIKRVRVDEFFGGRECVQVSVFMSVTNVHVNWYPVSGTVVYRKYHPGRYLVAWHPKSSELNERMTTVVDTGRGEVLFRQIAGFVARRIVSRAHEGDRAEQNRQFGFIKFGSRLDIFLPVDAEVLVKHGDRVTGTQTVLARMPR